MSDDDPVRAKARRALLKSMHERGGGPRVEVSIWRGKEGLGYKVRVADRRSAQDETPEQRRAMDSEVFARSLELHMALEDWCQDRPKRLHAAVTESEAETRLKAQRNYLRHLHGLAKGKPKG